MGEEASILGFFFAFVERGASFSLVRLKLLELRQTHEGGSNERQPKLIVFGSTSFPSNNCNITVVILIMIKERISAFAL